MCREFTLPGKVVTECHSIQSIGLAIGRMVKGSGKVGGNRQIEVGRNDGRDGDRMVGTCMLTDTDFSSGSAGGDPIENSVVFCNVVA